MNVPIPDNARKALLSKFTSKHNKIHLVIGWTYRKNIILTGLGPASPTNRE